MAFSRIKLAQKPEAIALEHEATRWTYLELNQRSSRIAHRLRQAGTQPDSLVGICMQRSADLIAAMLAILKAGSAYVPIDPAYPAERRSLMLEGVPLLLTTKKLARVVQMTNKRALFAYKLNPYPGRVTLFRAKDPNDGYEYAADNGWSALAKGGVEIHNIPGEHEEIFAQPNVRELAKKTGCLHSCGSRGGEIGGGLKTGRRGNHRFHRFHRFAEGT
jgi:acyl-CoA synthetase (AMP-forming)/AMP-acid ligase II